jgi:hypothetical protein
MRALRTRWLPAAVVALLAAVPAVTAQEAAPAGKPIDVVICLDTSNSMDGLIASAKVKLWDIVNDLAKVKPTPDLRVALYSYGNDGYDAGKGWVRKELDFTNDLDEVYRKLNGLTTNGGTELVARVSRDALRDLKWRADKNAFKLMFVAGNEPANQDKEVSLESVADQAKKQGVVINPIHCGGPDQTWANFAALTGGKLSLINQQGGAVAVATPHDKELADLGTKLNATYVVYGRKGKDGQANQVAQDGNAAKLGAGVEAARAVTKGGALYCNSAWCLVDKVIEDPKFDIRTVKEEDLSDEMKKMTPDERVAFVKKKLDERTAIKKQIEEVGAKRQKIVDEETRKNAKEGDKAFDVAIRAVIREQAAQKGIEIPK